MNFRVQFKYCPLSATKSSSDSKYWDCSGNIFNFLKYSLQEPLFLIPTMILIIHFCILKIALL